MERICFIDMDETTYRVQYEWPSELKALIFRVYSVWLPVWNVLKFQGHKLKPDKPFKAERMIKTSRSKPFKN
jgi:hypothetical protein